MLREIGAEPLQGKGPLNTAEWWRVVGEGRLPFTVPIDSQGRCDLWAFRRIYETQGGRPLHDI